MTALLNIDLKTFILTLCALMTAWMGLSKILDFMIEKIGIETKASLRRKKVDASLKEIVEMQSSMKQLKEMMEIHIEKVRPAPSSLCAPQSGRCIGIL